jgi:lysine 2,3-aminomutase
MNKELLSADEFEPPSTEPPSTGASREEVVPAQTKFLFSQPEKSKIIQIRRVPSMPRFRVGPRALAFRKRFFPQISSNEWNDWQWQLRNRITEPAMLEAMLKLADEEKSALTHSGRRFPVSITPYYASLLDRENPLHPLRRTVVPVIREHAICPAEKEDPLEEEHDSPVPGLVHRYPDRVLFLVTEFCSTYCRYCTRSRIVGNGRSSLPQTARWEEAIHYIESNPSVRDVLLSGGDPLTLPDASLEWLLSRLRRIPHVEFLRIGTKAPVVLPQRVTPSLVRILKRFHPLWMSIHFTHPEELTPETTQACERLADGGIPLGSQTVLLSGINDDVSVLRKLVHGLLRTRVKPYYLYQCDPISGSSHFRTPVERGIEMIEGLRGHTTGYGVPSYVIDAPGGGGKIPLLPEYLVGREGGDLLLRNYEGKIYRYPDPEGTIGERIQHGERIVSNP